MICANLLTFGLNTLDLNIDYYREQLSAKEDMLERTTKYLLDAQNKLIIQNDILTGVNESLFESIGFANMIQNALLPDASVLRSNMSGGSYRVENKIGIGGDSVFIKEWTDCVTFGLLDATGHGIPAAMLSISGVMILNELLAESARKSPDELLARLNARLHATFNSERSIAHLEGSILSYYPSERRLDYSCAKGKGIYLPKSGELIDLHASRYSVGEDTSARYTKRSIDCSPGDRLLLFSDGLTDQFGGEHNKKFTKRRLKGLLQNAAAESITGLADLIFTTHLEWKGSSEQTDDVSFLVISF